MNKVYPVKQLCSGNLQEINPNYVRSGIKNVIGIIVEYNGENLFYSIFDDCFFRLLPSDYQLYNNESEYLNKIYVDVFDRYNYSEKSFGIQLYERIGIEFISKHEIKEKRKHLIGYFSDLSYLYLKMDTNVDYEDVSTIEDNIISTELAYEQKLDRPIAYTDGLRMPSSRKRLIKF